mgnify:CR=1 FL=1
MLIRLYNAFVGMIVVTLCSAVCRSKYVLPLGQPVTVRVNTTMRLVYNGYILELNGGDVYAR